MDNKIKKEEAADNLLSSLSDTALIELLHQDSTAAFETLYIRYKNKLQVFCLFMLKSPTVAQDVVQEVFIKVWTMRRTLNTEQSFANFVYTLAKNQSLNELRSAKRKETMEDMITYQEESNQAESVETKLIIKEYQELLDAAISQLPEHKRRIYSMSRNEGLSHKEIAAILQISPHTVQSHISDSLRSISEYFFKNADMELYCIFITFALHT